jgi:Putative MetA-pathway of phenol degradation
VAADDSDIVADRPGFGESASAVGRGRVQIEAGAAWTRLQPGAETLDLPQTLARIGVANALEVRIVAPDWVRLRSGGSAISGWTDMTVGLKGHLAAGGSDFSLRGTAYLPTGGPGQSEDRVDPEVAAAWSRSFSPAWSLGATVNVHRFRLVHQTFTSPSVSLGRGLGKHLATFLEYGANLASGVQPAQKLDNGYTWILHGRTQLDVSIGVALSAIAPDFFVGMGVCRRF